MLINVNVFSLILKIMKTSICYNFINKDMNEKYNVYLVSDSTGETLDRIFLSLKSQFANFEYEKKEFAFIRTEQQIDKIIKECNQVENSIILYTIVETKLAKYLAKQSDKNLVPCFGVLGNLILSFSKAFKSESYS